MKARVIAWATGTFWAIFAASLLWEIREPSRLIVLCALGGWAIIGIAWSFQAFARALEAK